MHMCVAGANFCLPFGKLFIYITIAVSFIQLISNAVLLWQIMELDSPFSLRKHHLDLTLRFTVQISYICVLFCVNLTSYNFTFRQIASTVTRIT